MSRADVPDHKSDDRLKRSAITLLKLLALNLMTLTAVAVAAFLRMPGQMVLIIVSHVLQILLLVSLISFLVQLVRSPADDHRSAGSEMAKRKGGVWVVWTMGLLVLLSVFLMIPVVALADLSEFGALGLFFVLLFGTPVPALLAVVLPWFAPANRKNLLSWMRAVILAAVLLTWLVFLVRAGFFG